MHEGIKRKSEVRCAQVAPGASRGLPYLGLNVHPLLGIDPPADHQHVSVRKRGACGVPATVVHIRQAGPGIAEWVINVGIRDAHVITYVPTCHPQTAIGKESMA